MMKKSLILLLLLPLALHVSGQNEKFEPEWNVGAGFGPVFSSVDFESGAGIARLSTKNIQQFHGGIAVRYLSEKRLGLIAELNYIQQGWEQDFAETPQYSHIHKLNYLELPILTHIYFGRKVRFIINFGPKLSFLINDSETINEPLAEYLAGGRFPEMLPSYQYYHKAERKLDYGLTGGLGLELRTGIGHFTLEGRYSFGLGDIYNNSKSDYFTRSANRAVSVKLTYYVKLF